MHRHATSAFAGLRVCGERLVGQGDQIAGKVQNLAQRFAVLTGLGEPNASARVSRSAAEMRASTASAVIDFACRCFRRPANVAVLPAEPLWRLFGDPLGRKHIAHGEHARQRPTEVRDNSCPIRCESCHRP